MRCSRINHKNHLMKSLRIVVNRTRGPTTRGQGGTRIIAIGDQRAGHKTGLFLVALR